MPTPRNYTASELLEGFRAIVNRFRSRPGASTSVSKQYEESLEQNRELEQVRQRLARKDQELTRLRAMLAKSGNGIPLTRICPENVIWIFGSGRSGSSWLGRMMGHPGGYQQWNEPLVGRLFGEFYGKLPAVTLGRSDFIMGEPSRGAWLEAIRFFVLSVAEARFPEVNEDNYLVTKEPNGSVGAPLLMEALPESRMILLLRDPRDVLSSALDSHRRGGHGHKRSGKKQSDRNRADDNPNAFVRMRANQYVQSVGSAKQAYDSHDGYKVLVKYEDLRAHTLETIKRIYSTLEIPIDKNELASIVEQHSWENIPEEAKGSGKSFRKATPGGWREDLSPKQVEIVEKVTAPLIEEFYAQ